MWFGRLFGAGAAKQGREMDRRILVFEGMESECKRDPKKRWRQGDRRRMGLWMYESNGLPLQQSSTVPTHPRRGVLESFAFLVLTAQREWGENRGVIVSHRREGLVCFCGQGAMLLHAIVLTDRNVLRLVRMQSTSQAGKEAKPKIRSQRDAAYPNLARRELDAATTLLLEVVLTNINGDVAAM